MSAVKSDKTSFIISASVCYGECCGWSRRKAIKQCYCCCCWASALVCTLNPTKRKWLPFDNWPNCERCCKATGAALPWHRKRCNRTHLRRIPEEGHKTNVKILCKSQSLPPKCGPLIASHSGVCMSVCLCGNHRSGLHRAERWLKRTVPTRSRSAVLLVVGQSCNALITATLSLNLWYRTVRKSSICMQNTGASLCCVALLCRFLPRVPSVDATLHNGEAALLVRSGRDGMAADTIIGARCERTRHSRSIGEDLQNKPKTVPVACARLMSFQQSATVRRCRLSVVHLHLKMSNQLDNPPGDVTEL